MAKDDKDLFPLVSGNGNLLFVVKPGIQVLFYENDKLEVYHASKAELARRLYKVTGLTIKRVQQYEYGMMTFKHNQEAQAAKELKARNGVWKNEDSYRPVIVMYHTQIKALIEGKDFHISVTGEIRFIHNA